MQGMFLAPGAEFLQLNPTRVIPSVFLGGVVTLIAFRAGERNHRPYSFFASHNLFTR
jgi:hypothetical protein